MKTAACTAAALLISSGATTPRQPQGKFDVKVLTEINSECKADSEKTDFPPVGCVEFDWSQDDSVILRQQPETACYYNAEGSLVIRQRGWPDEDSVVIIAAPCVDAFIDGLSDIAGIPSVGKRR
jgi:hypothetical protein